MNRSQRIVVILYCIALAYCCVWVPWHVEWQSSSHLNRPTSDRVGYGWVWSGPETTANWYSQEDASADLTLILLRVGAVSASAVALFLLAGFLSHHRNVPAAEDVATSTNAIHAARL